MAIKHFRIELKEAFEPTGISGACVRSCLCCGKVICGMGGGADYICQLCVEKMVTGEVARALSIVGDINSGRGGNETN